MRYLRSFPFARSFPFELALWVFAFAFGAHSQQAGSASLHGAVRDSQGNSVADAAVELRPKDSSETLITHTDSRGAYDLIGVQNGVYRLRVTKSGYADAEVSSVFLAPKETKSVDLILGPAKTSASAVEKPQFFDRPQFTVSGVTDTTNLGGHGSDTVVRTREALAKQTVSLGKTSVSQSDSLSVSVASLQERAARIRTLLAQQEKPELHHQLGDIEERLGDSLAAVHHYQRAAEMDPSETHLFDWGSDLLLHHAPEPAIEVFTNGNRLFPRSARFLIGLSAAWFTLGNNTQAVQRGCEASDLSPDDPSPYLFLGRMLEAQTAPSDDVVQRLHRFVTLQPQNADANYYYGVALSRLRQGPQDKKDWGAQAESFLNSALRLDPNYAAAYLQVGILHSQQGNYNAAVSDYRRAAQLDPRLEQAHYRLAQAYRQLGQTDKATEELRVYEQLTQESAERAEHERREIRQFVYTLRDQPAIQAP